MLPLALTILSIIAADNAPARIDIAMPTGPHPNIFLKQDEQTHARELAATQPWAKKIAATLQRSADALVNKPLDILRKGGQWSHWYTCAKDGSRLKTESPTRHVCPACAEVYTGYPYDEVYFTRQHSAWLNGVQTLGMAYALNPKPEYAQRVRDILLEYAAFYESLPLHDRDGGLKHSAARLFAQTLNTGVMLCSIGMGYDLVYDAPCFSKEDHAAIADHLLRPMVKTIRRNPSKRSNWQSWHNGGIATVGFLLGDEEMVDFAINDPQNGFLFQMRESVLPSGMWYEGAPSYHWYALKPLVYLLEAAHRSGIDLYPLLIVKKLFTAPMIPLFPDMTYPAINDSSRGSIKSSRWFYEVAYKRYGDPNFLALRDPRDSAYTLLWGKEAPEGAPVPKLKLASSNDLEAGLAILRDTRRDIALFFNYSPESIGHTHQAKLDIILYANGDERIVDPGRLLYGNPLHKEWYKQSIAHNTVVVNEYTPKRAVAAFREFEARDDWSLARADLDKTYEGVHLDRTVFMRDGIIVDIFRCTANSEKTFDLPLHFKGTLTGLPQGKPAQLALKNGYQHLRNMSAVPQETLKFTVNTGEETAIHVTTFDQSQVYLAEGRAQPSTLFIPTIIRRQTDTSATFITIYQILAKGESPQTITHESGNTIRVSFNDTAILVAPDSTQIQLNGTTVYAAQK